MEENKQRESEVLSISFNPADPMVTIYCPIEQLYILAATAGIPYSVQQQLEICITLIRDMRDIEKVLGEWNAKVSGDKTWAAFKSHFKNAQAELKKSVDQPCNMQDTIMQICLRRNCATIYNVREQRC